MASRRTTPYPVAMTGYRFEVVRRPPELGERTAEVFEEWMEEGALAGQMRSEQTFPSAL